MKVSQQAAKLREAAQAERQRVAEVGGARGGRSQGRRCLVGCLPAAWLAARLHGHASSYVATVSCVEAPPPHPIPTPSAHVDLKSADPPPLLYPPPHAQEKRKQSFNDREKKKRKEGKVSRDGSTVEQEKRRARAFGVYSGFD